MNRRKFFIIGGLILLSVVLILLYLLTRGPQEIRVSDPIGSNLGFPHAVDTNTVRFYNSGRFVEMNLSTGQTKTLTEPRVFPDVTDVEWYDTGALFKATNYTPNDDLFERARNGNVSLDAPQWWYINFNSGSLTLLRTVSTEDQVGFGAVKAADANYAYLINEAVGDGLEGSVYTIGRIDLTTGEKVSKPVGAEFARLLWADDDEVIMQQGKKLLRYNFLTESKTPIEDNVSPLVEADANPAGDKLVFAVSAPDENITDAHDLPDQAYIVRDLKNNVSTQITKGAYTSFVFGPDNYLFGVEQTSGGSAHIAVVKDDGTEYKRYGVSVEDKIVGGTFAMLSGEKLKVLATDTLGTGYLLGEYGDLNDNLHAQTTDQFSNGRNVYGPGYYIAYFPNEDRYQVYITSGDFKAQQQAVADYFGGLGLDINQLEITWYRPESL